jgi:hypothetical protein
MEKTVNNNVVLDKSKMFATYSPNTIRRVL